MCETNDQVVNELTGSLKMLSIRQKRARYNETLPSTDQPTATGAVLHRSSEGGRGAGSRRAVNVRVGLPKMGILRESVCPPKACHLEENQSPAMPLVLPGRTLSSWSGGGES